MPDLTQFLACRGNISSAFTLTVERTLSLAHPAASTVLQQGRLNIVATTTVPDYDASLRYQTPRGWTAASTWAEADGCFHGPTRSVVVAEGCLKNGKLAPSGRVAGVLLHELGHGIDLALGDFSHSATFVAAYLADLAEILGTPIEAKLGYFVQGFNLGRGELSCAGLSETMAECFATIGGITPNPRNRLLMLRAFPRTISAVRHRLDKL